VLTCIAKGQFRVLWCEICLKCGVQATVQAHGEFTIDHESEEGWSKVGLTSPQPWDLVGQPRIRVHETTTTALREAGRPSGSRVVYATYGMNWSAHQTPQAARSGFHTTSRGPGIPRSIQLPGSHVGGSPNNVGSPQ
jgi:hypothetical protein